MNSELLFLNALFIHCSVHDLLHETIAKYFSDNVEKVHVL